MKPLTCILYYVKKIFMIFAPYLALGAVNGERFFFTTTERSIIFNNKPSLTTRTLANGIIYIHSLITKRNECERKGI